MSMASDKPLKTMRMWRGEAGTSDSEMLLAEAVVAMRFLACRGIVCRLSRKAEMHAVCQRRGKS